MSRTERVRLRNAAEKVENTFNDIGPEVAPAQGIFEALRLQSKAQMCTAMAVLDLADEVTQLTETIRRGFKEMSL